MQAEHPLLFDGTPNCITSVEAVYCLRLQIKPPSSARPFVLWEYRERLLLDRAADALTYIQEDDDGWRITHRYELPGGVGSLLDGMPLDLFSTVKGDPPDAMDDPARSRTYVLTVCTRYGGARTIAGSYDRDNLPEDWPAFIDAVLDWMNRCEVCDLFDPRLYGRRKRRRSDYIYCRVSFESGGQCYSYLARDDSYAEGDWVIVPAGRENREALGRIESIDYCAAGEAPYPVERTKYILRKYEGGRDDAGE